MADNETAPDESSPFARPTFLVAAVVVLIIALLGAIIAVRVSRSNNTSTTPPASTAPSSMSADPATTAADSDSVCGLKATTQESPATGPAATWKYEGTIAYPESPEFGPGKTASEGYRFCFAHTPSGALFATANALAQPMGSHLQPWAEYFVSQGSGRAKILAELDQPANGTAGIRVRIVGFKLLAYSERTARVDVAVEASGSATTVLGSYVYELIWEGGDWKLNSGTDPAFNFATIPNSSGYVPWGA